MELVAGGAATGAAIGGGGDDAVNPGTEAK
jgi:hypothetical protein